MEENLIRLLDTFGYPVRRQGSFADDEEYPDTFFTFWNNGEYEASAYDNSTKRVTYDFDVNVYSTDTEKTYELLDKARKLLKSSGYITPTRAYDVASDENTHTGRGMNAQITINEIIKEA